MGGELEELLKSFESGFWTKERLDELFRLVDVDEGGKIVRQEFVQWLFGASSGSLSLRCTQTIVPWIMPECKLRSCQGRRGCQCQKFTCPTCGRMEKLSSRRSGRDDLCRLCTAIRDLELQETRTGFSSSSARALSTPATAAPRGTNRSSTLSHYTSVITDLVSPRSRADMSTAISAISYDVVFKGKIFTGDRNEVSFATCMAFNRGDGIIRHVGSYEDLQKLTADGMLQKADWC